jgi:hypothetical protein
MPWTWFGELRHSRSFLEGLREWVSEIKRELSREFGPNRIWSGWRLLRHRNPVPDNCILNIKDIENGKVMKDSGLLIGFLWFGKIC